RRNAWCVTRLDRRATAASASSTTAPTVSRRRARKLTTLAVRELVTDSVDRHEERLVLRVLDLAAQTHDVSVHRAVERVVVVPERPLPDLLPRENPSRRADECRQEIEFRAGERDRPPAHQSLPRREIEND